MFKRFLYLLLIVLLFPATPAVQAASLQLEIPENEGFETGNMISSDLGLYVNKFSAAYDPASGGIHTISITKNYSQTFALAHPTQPGRGTLGPFKEWNESKMSISGATLAEVSIDFYSDGTNSKEGIAYYDSASKSLFFIESINGGLASPQIVFPNHTPASLDAGQAVRFKYDSFGRPYIVFRKVDTNAISLVLAKPLDSISTACGGESTKFSCYELTSVLPWADPHFAEKISLSFDANQKPAIAYIDKDNHRLMLATQANNPAIPCTPGIPWNCEIVSDSPAYYRGMSFQGEGETLNDKRFAFYDSDVLIYAEYKGGGQGTCSLNSNYDCIAIQTFSGVSVSGVDLTTDNHGEPVISYNYVPNGSAGPETVYIARPLSAYLGTFLAFGNCGPRLLMFGTWSCQEIFDPGLQYLPGDTYGEQTRVFVDDAGLLTVFYTVFESALQTRGLRVAKQLFHNYLPAVQR